VNRQLERDLIEAAVRRNEADLGRLPPATTGNGRRAADRRSAVLRWSPVLLVAIAGAAFAWLRLSGTEAEALPTSLSAPSAPAPTELTLAAQTAAEPEPGPAGATRTEAAAEPELRLAEPPEAPDPRVFSLPVRRIMLDPGHGGSAFGTTGGGLAEKDLALDIAFRLQALLEKEYLVAMTREVDIDVDLQRRSGLANRTGADLFISIHVNWLTENQICGVETYYLGPADDPEQTALVERENSESHTWSLGDLRRLLDGVYAQARQEESRALAAAIQQALVDRLRPSNPELRDRGVKSAPFFVLIGAEMPAILAEVSCLSDAREVERLRDESWRQSIAEALDAGIRNYADSLLLANTGSEGGAMLPGSRRP